MRDRSRALVVVSSSLFLTVLLWYNYSAVLPIVVEEWNLTGLRAGLVFGAFQAGYLLAILPVGVLADRYSPRWLVAVGATGAGLWSLAFALLATGFLTGTAFRFLAGLFVAGVYVPGMRFVTDWYPSASRGRAMGLYVGTFSLSSGLSFALTSAIAEFADWRVAVAVTSGGALAVAPIVLFGADDAPGTADAGSTSVDLSVFRNREYLHAVNVYAWHNWELFGTRNWLLAFLLATPAFATAGGYSPTVAGLLVGVVTAMSAVGNVGGGWLSDRIGRPKTIGLGLAGSTAIVATLGFLGGLPLWALAGVLLPYGALVSLDSAPTSTLVTEVVDGDTVGAALSGQSFVGFVPSVVSPAVFGLALDHGGYGLAWPTLAIAGVFGLASVGVLHSRTAGVSHGAEETKS